MMGFSRTIARFLILPTSGSEIKPWLVEIVFWRRFRFELEPWSYRIRETCFVVHSTGGSCLGDHLELMSFEELVQFLLLNLGWFGRRLGLYWGIHLSVDYIETYRPSAM